MHPQCSEVTPPNIFRYVAYFRYKGIISLNSHFNSALDRTQKRCVVGQFKVRADGHTLGKSGDLDVKGL